jgi:hypothetical protein
MEDTNMERITTKQLEAVVERINRMTNSPLTPYSNGKPNAHCYHLDWAYGGVSLVRMAEVGTGISHPIGGGFFTKKELYFRMQAFICGLEAKKD